MKCRRDGYVQSTAIVSAIVCGSDGIRRVVGVDCIDTENYVGWLEFCRSLKKRGLRGVGCVTLDVHASLRQAIEECFCGASWQRFARKLQSF